jgi:hypothetical protein
MRTVFVAASIAAAIAGTLTTQALFTEGAEDRYSRDYLLVAQRAPDTLLSVISASLPACLSESARPYLSEVIVADLAAKTLFKSGVLMAEGRTAEDRSNELRTYVLGESGALSPTQRATYLSLLKGELLGPDKMLCVYSAVRASYERRVDLKAISWDLRI